MCIVQNQYGTDKLVVTLVVRSPPRPHRDAIVYLGGAVDLECKDEARPSPRVTWVLPNHAHMAAASLGLASQQRVVILSNGTLRISRAAVADGGVYQCIVSSATGSTTVSVRLHVSALPPVIQQTRRENKTLPEGAAAYIHCTATGAPPPAIRWTTPDGVRLTYSQFLNGHNIVLFPNGTLLVRRLGPGNSGGYECTAANEVASSSRTVILNVKRTPSSDKAVISSSSPQRTDVTYGGTLLLDCVASGLPEPRIIWKTPSKKLVDAQYRYSRRRTSWLIQWKLSSYALCLHCSFDSRIKVFPNGTMSVRSVTNKDGGDYLCVARNKLGDDYVLLRVNVLTRPAKIEQKQPRPSQEVVYGGDLKVDCVASGFPDPEISWALPDGTMVEQKEHVGGGRRRRYEPLGVEHKHLGQRQDVLRL